MNPYYYLNQVYNGKTGHKFQFKKIGNKWRHLLFSCESCGLNIAVQNWQDYYSSSDLKCYFYRFEGEFEIQYIDGFSCLENQIKDILE